MKPDFLIELLEKCKPLTTESKLDSLLASGTEYLRTTEFKTKQDKVNACLVRSTLKTFLVIEEQKRRVVSKAGADVKVLFTNLSKAPVVSTQEFVFI